MLRGPIIELETTGTSPNFDSARSDLPFQVGVRPPGKPRVEVPLEVEMEIIRQRALLNHYFPGAYPPNDMSANDDDDDDDG